METDKSQIGFDKLFLGDIGFKLSRLIAASGSLESPMVGKPILDSPQPVVESRILLLMVFASSRRRGVSRLFLSL